MKKILILFVCLLITICQSYPQEECKSANVYQSTNQIADDFRFYKNYAEQVKKERAAVANALQLSEDQAKKFLQLTLDTDKVLNEKFNQLYDANLKLRMLKSDNNNSKIISEQQNYINNIKCEIKKIIEEENKKFTKILNHEQRSKFKMIKKLQRKSINSAKHPKNYYKSNPKMREFAPHIKTN